MSSATRAQFLARGAKGGLALVAGGAVLGLAEGTALGAVTSDADIAKLAATAELLAIDFYTNAIGSKQLKGDELSYLVGAKENEVAHYNALKGVLKSATPSGLKFTYPMGSFTSRASIGKLGEALETAFVGAYMGAVGALSPHAAVATEANTTRKANIGSFFIYPLYFRSRWNRARLCGYARLVRDQIQIFFHPQPCRFSPTS